MGRKGANRAAKLWKAGLPSRRLRQDSQAASSGERNGATAVRLRSG